jgi:SAM-dependent methyltransferase
VGGDFSGEVAGFYARFRRGYPPPFIELLSQALRLGPGDVVADVGCGTGQLTLPLAERVRAVIGVDPEPDMLALARQAAAERGVANVTWVLGSDRDLAAAAALPGQGPLAAVTAANAVHLMSCQDLFATARPLLRPGGAIAVIANGMPLWQQPTPWSRAVRRALEEWLDTRLESCCGTDAQSRLRYREAMTAAGFADVHEEAVDYDGQLTFDELIGGLCSAMPVRLLPPPEQRAAFAQHIRRFAGPGEEFTEHVRVAALIGHVPVNR